ncbi:UNVERIFIED_CONTAM: hypothetical protein O1L25_14220, partial [Pseudomonas aeruginosa]
FDLEFFRVTLTTHDTSYLGLIMRLGGVYETRGDSVVAESFPADIRRWGTIEPKTNVSRDECCTQQRRHNATVDLTIPVYVKAWRISMLLTPNEG